MKLIIAMISLFSIFYQQSWAAPTCEKVHNEALDSSAKLRLIREAFTEARFAIDPDVFSGRIRPKWQSYDLLVKLSKLLEDPSLRIKDSKEAMTLQNESQEFRKFIDGYVQRRLAEPKGQQELDHFVDVHFTYFHLIEEINKKLGAKVFPEADLSRIRTNPQLVKDGEKLVSRMEERLLENFDKTGHKSLKEFKTYTQKFSPNAKKLLKVVEDDFDIAMHRPESARFWVPIAGFQNQRVTGSSNGSMFGDTSIPNARDDAEAKFVDMPVDEYFPKSPRLKPVYAEARPSVLSKDVAMDPRADHYGSDIWILKKDALKARTSWSPSDSLQLRTVSDVTLNVLPWKYRAFITPYLLRRMKTDVPSLDLLPGNPPDGFQFNIGEWPYLYYGYLEVQVWGPVTIDDVKAFSFKGKPPEKEFYNYLVSKGIEVYDERKWPAKLYDGSESN